MYLNNLFVYGTLLPGLANYHRFIAAYKPQVFPARARGVMYYLPQDDYPVVLEGEGTVKGVVFSSEQMPLILPEIDEIQKYTGVESQSHLIREIKDVRLLETGETIKAHMYLWPPSRADWLKKNGVVILDGDWARFLRVRNGGR
ncbi:gamma-glutamylcyclotransferase family protein [Desulfurispora thermophila]|uniref:gamma-glutamylcyclotransferase family protein n=1 Tax=Desulfurispora thermophila TaxID=265470 RepID=UPI00037B6D3C|nr:gamma-glutamylcyclotransferase family protein [Desulfurispora thermophila]